MNYSPDILLRFACKADFLAWEEQQDTRFEFDGKHVTEVTGATVNHIIIMVNIAVALQLRLRGTPFMVLPQVKIETIPGYRYPDITVGPRGADGTKTILPDPIVVFEVLSPSTSQVDLGRKRSEYGALASIRRYVILESDQIGGRQLARASDGTWVETALDAAGRLDLPEIGVHVPLADLYEDVTF